MKKHLKTALILLALLLAFGIVGRIDHDTEAALVAEYPDYFRR